MVVPSSSKRDPILKLIAERDSLEIKIREQGRVLQANDIGMNESLVDEQGFPRNDIDVYQVRTARHQIIILQNDLKLLMKEIEKGLQEVHAEEKLNNPNGLNTRKITENMDVDEQQQRRMPAPQKNPFVKVNLVSPGSPAEVAGLLVCDEIVEFGTINVDNFSALTQIAEIVQSCVHRNINIRVKRGAAYHELMLTPKAWAGRGFLGCNVVPMDSIER